MTQNASNLCWLDMEMTGLDPERERIIEVAMIITDSDLNVLAQSEVYAVHQVERADAQMGGDRVGFRQHIDVRLGS